MKIIQFLKSLWYNTKKPNHKSVHKLTINTIDGMSLPLSEFRGKKILIVNVASECGLTPQYEQLQQLQERFSDTLAIIGVPCNDFAEQEPGEPEQIKHFCIKNYGVTFTLTEKVNIKTNPIHPLYLYLTSKEQNQFENSVVEWNFQKYLLNEKGELVALFAPSVEPLSEDIVNLLLN